MLQNATFTSCTSLNEPPNTSEYLRLPKSTLKTHLAHGAKSDVESDFKFETEYLLDCSIPNKPPEELIFLEDCLFEYFTNIVQVRRELSTPGDQSPKINYHTKPRLSSSLSYSQATPPPYVGNGNGFYGGDEKAALKAVLQPQTRNVAAWQVSLYFDLTYDSFSNCCPIMYLLLAVQIWQFN
jgi:hypothetical protein